MNGRTWSSGDTATLQRMASAGYTDGEIARHLGRDRPFVCRKRHQMGIERGVSPMMRAALQRIRARRFALDFSKTHQLAG